MSELAKVLTGTWMCRRRRRLSAEAEYVARLGRDPDVDGDARANRGRMPGFAP